MREPIRMPALPGHCIRSFSDPEQDGRWNSMNDESFRAHDRKLKLPVSKPSWRQATSTSACVQLHRKQTNYCIRNTVRQQVLLNSAKCHKYNGFCKILLLASLMGQYRFACCRLSVVVCSAASGRAALPPGAWAADTARRASTVTSR